MYILVINFSVMLIKSKLNMEGLRKHKQAKIAFNEDSII